MLTRAAAVAMLLHAVAPAVASAQGFIPQGPPPSAAGEQPDPSGARGYDRLRVIEAVCVTAPEPEARPVSQAMSMLPVSNTAERPRAGFFDDIMVRVEGLHDWARVPGHDASRFLLYIQGQPLAITPQLDRIHDGVLHFRLRHPSSAEDRQTWKGILGRPNGSTKLVRLTIGLPQQLPVPSTVALRLVEFSRKWLLVYAVAFVVLVIAFVLAARRSSILREGPTTKLGVRPYSLGRTQMAWWFFLSSASYVFIWMLTGDAQALSGTVLTLIGISAGTALGAVVIDQNKENAADARRVALEAEVANLRPGVAALTKEVAAMAGQPDAVKKQELEDKTTRLKQKEAELTECARSTVRLTTGRFWSDLLGDGSGITFHRFQMAAWTLILGAMFVASVYNDLSMPEFSTELLALMGISGGTYLGFKLPEPQA